MNCAYADNTMHFSLPTICVLNQTKAYFIIFPNNGKKTRHTHIQQVAIFTFKMHLPLSISISLGLNNASFRLSILKSIMTAGKLKESKAHKYKTFFNIYQSLYWF